MYEERLQRVRDQMQLQSAEAMVLGPGADLRYLTGYVATASERLTALVVPLDSDPVLMAPALEAVAAEQLPVQIQPWTEAEEPLDLVSAVLKALGARRVGIGDHLWSRFLLGLQERCPQVEWIPASRLLSPLRLIKDEHEMKHLARAGAAADRVWGRLVRLDLEGKTERQLSALLAELMLDEGLDGAAFSIVAAGPNGASPHHESGSSRLADGDMVVVDFGGPLEGYHSDITRMLHLGQPDNLEREVYAAVLEAQERATRAVRPGAAASDVDNAARSYLSETGWGEHFIHRTGHGLGLELHEPPYIRGDLNTILQPGMVFSVEPGVYLPGRFGVRIEDIVAVTASGVQRLNNAPRELAVL